MVTSTDLTTLSTATLQLYAPDLDAETWVTHAFRFLLALAPGDMVNFGSLDTVSGTLHASTTCDGPDWGKAVVGFAAFMRKYDYFSFDPSVAQGRPFFRSDFVSDRQFVGLDIYSECFRLLGTIDHAAVHVPTGDGCLTWFAIERGGHREFSERDRTMLAIAQQHLANAWRLAQARRAAVDRPRLDAAFLTKVGFSPREADVAVWLAEGKTNLEIATLMGVRVQTVKGHVAALFDKTGHGNRLALVLHLLALKRRAPDAPHQLERFDVRDWRRAGLVDPSAPNLDRGEAVGEDG